MPSRRESLLKFLEQDPSDSFTRYAIALEFISEGNTFEGERYLRQTIERDEEYIPAYHQLGQLYAREERNDEAIKAYTDGIAAAIRQGDAHARSEMQQELDELKENM